MRSIILLLAFATILVCGFQTFTLATAIPWETGATVSVGALYEILRWLGGTVIALLVFIIGIRWR